MKPLRRCLAAIAACAAMGLAAADEPRLPRAGFVGVQIGEVSEAVRAAQHLADRRGVAVMGLVEGGSAQHAGLRAGDVVVAVDERTIAGPADFIATVARLRGGDRVTLHYVRDGEPATVPITIRPRPVESAPDVATEYRALAVDGALRRTIVTRPRDEAKHPAVLYITGIGCFSQESVDLRTTEAKLLYGLSRAGFVTMRVEKSGIGDSQGPACDSEEVGLRAEAAGYAAGLKALRAYPFVDPSNLFIVGLSIGGVEAPLAAQQVPVKGIVAINTVARGFLDYLQDIRRLQLRLRGVPYDEIERRLALNERCNHRFLVEGLPRRKVLQEDMECKELVTYPATDRFMQEWAALNLAAEWKRVDAKVLVLHGEYDFVSSAFDGPYLRDMLESYRPGSASYEVVANMDHYLGRVDSMAASLAKDSGGLGEFQPAVLAIVTDWLRRQVQPPA